MISNKHISLTLHLHTQDGVQLLFLMSRSDQPAMLKILLDNKVDIKTKDEVNVFTIMSTNMSLIL